MELADRARQGDLEGVKRLIQQHVKVNAKTRNNQSALYCACENGHAEVVKYLLDHGASVSRGAKPLITAARYNHYNCAELLLQHNADVNCTNSKKETPMSVALLKQNYSIVLLLLQYNAIPSASLRDSAVQLLKCAKVEHTRAIQKLIDEKIIDLMSEDTFLAAFNYAFHRGSVDLAEKMLSNDCHPKIEQLYSNVAYYSAKNNWPSVTSRLIEKGVDMDIMTGGLTPLYVACKEGHESVVMLLLNNGADPNKLTASYVDFKSPLQIVVHNRYVAIFNMLLEKGAKVDQAGEPLLHIACSDTSVMMAAVEAGEAKPVELTLSMIRLLLQQGVDVNAISVKGDTALYRACESGHLQIVQILLEAGANVNLTSRGRYPLIAACKAGNVALINVLVKAGTRGKGSNSIYETCLHAFVNACLPTTGVEKPPRSVSKSDIENIIKLLLESGVDVNARCCYGETALYRASKAGHGHIVRLLLEAGAETAGLPSCRPLYAACERGCTEVVDLLLQHAADPNVSTSVVSSTRLPDLPICCAVKKGYTDIVELLLKHGTDANKKDQSGKTALMHFIESLASGICKASHVMDPLEERNRNILKCILLAGGDVNVSDRDGCNALHIASSFGMCDIIMELIKHGANCNHLTSSRKSALNLACENGHEAAVEMLLKNSAKTDRESATTCLQSSSDLRKCAMPVICTAAKNGSETMVRMILKYGADVNASNEEGNAALHMATSHSIIEMLLNAGANVNAENDNGDTALSIVCEKRQIDTSVIEMLLKFGADPNVGFPLHAACENNDLDAVQLLLAYGADPNLIRKSVTVTRSYVFGIGMVERSLSIGTESSPLCSSCKHGNVAMVGCLLQHGADTAFTDSNGNSSLHLAVQRLGEHVNSEEYDPIITLLLQHNAPVNVFSSSGESPLYLASMKGLTGVVKQLLDCRADVGLTASKSNKYPLLIACQNKFRDVAMMLLERGADPNVSKDRQTPLKLAAVYGDVVLLRQLISCGANLNQMQNIGDTALHDAVRHCKYFVLQKLLKCGANINALNSNGETALCLACRPTADTVNINIVRTLLEHGADPNICPPSPSYRDWYHALSPLSTVASGGNSEFVSLLIKFGAKLDHSDKLGRTALHFAVGYESTKCYTSTVEVLLSAGADINALDTNGASPLFLAACDRGKTELVKLLLSHGANPNVGTRDKLSIHAACRGQHYESTKLLMEYKADVTACDETGKTALHHAVEFEPRLATDKKDTRYAMVQLLLKGGASVNATSKGESPIYVACAKGLTSIAKKMLVSGADINNCRKLPLIIACRNKHVSVAKLLLTHGADSNVSEEGNTALHTAARNDNSEIVELLLKHSAIVDIANGDGNTALHLAIKCYHSTAYALRGRKSVIDILLENKADVNVPNINGETPLYAAVSEELPGVVSKMLQVYGGDPNKGLQDGSALAAACQKQNVLSHGAGPNLQEASASCDLTSSLKLPLFVAVDNSNIEIIMSLLNAGASVSATDHEGRSAVCFAAENLTIARDCYQYMENVSEILSAIHLLLEHGANFTSLLPDGHSPLHLVISVLPTVLRRGGRHKRCVLELLQLMVQHGAVLLDSSSQLGNASHQALSSGTLKALTAFDGNHKFIVDLLRAGAGFQLIASCCSAVSTTSVTSKSIALCQAAVLAGYVLGAEEVANLQLAAANENTADLKQLVDWLNEDRQQVPSLFRQCRIAIRRQMSVSTQNRTILPAIDQLPLPNNLKLYLQFDGQMSEVDLSINDDNQSQSSETTEEESSAENSDYYYNSDSDYRYDYEYDGYANDNCCGSDCGSDCDHDLWWL